jgi:hypothetical protein
VREQDRLHRVAAKLPARQLSEYGLSRFVVARVNQRHFAGPNRHESYAYNSVLHDADAVDLESVCDGLPPHERAGDRADCDD